MSLQDCTVQQQCWTHSHCFGEPGTQEQRALKTKATTPRVGGLIKMYCSLDWASKCTLKATVQQLTHNALQLSLLNSMCYKLEMMHRYLYRNGAECMRCSNSIHLPSALYAALLCLKVGSQESQVAIFRPFLKAFMQLLQSLLRLAWICQKRRMVMVPVLATQQEVNRQRSELNTRKPLCCSCI